MGVPHPEIGLILADGRSVDFAHRLRPGERISLYPPFANLDISGLSRVAPPPQPARFVLDGHLWRLAGEQGRIVLSRDRGVLKRRQVIHGYAPRRDDPRAKLLPPHTRESYSRFHRCRDCGRIYWRGAHAQRIEALIAAVRSQGLEAGATETRPPVSPRGSC
jgi:hypothetical protein